MDVAKAFGLVLRQLRIDKGFSQEQLAAKAGLDRTFISMLERGVRQPTLATLFSLARSLGVSPQECVRKLELKMRRARWARGQGGRSD